MNYASFFVVLSALGIVVFIGIFSAAWLTAADREPEHSQPDLYPALLSPNNGPAIPETQNQTVTPDGITISPDLISYSTAAAAGDEDNDESFKDLSASQNTPAKEENPTKIGNSPTEKQDDEPADATQQSSSEAPQPPTDPPGVCQRKTLTEDGNIIITSDEYKNEESCTEWIIKYETGYSVYVTVEKLELDFASKDYLVILADKNRIDNEANSIFISKLSKKRTFLIRDTGNAYILFVTHRNEKDDPKPSGFRISYNHSGDLNNTEVSTTPSIIPKANIKHTVTGYVKGANATEFSNTKISDFKSAMTKRAISFCDEKGIGLTNTGVNVTLTLIRDCPREWPDGNICVEVKMAIGVNAERKKYALNETELRDMWDDWNGDELTDYKLKKYEKPNFKKSMLIWILTLLLIIIILCVFLTYLWQCQLNSQLEKEDRKPSCTATLQEVPPFFEYMEDKIDDPEYIPQYNSLYYMDTETSTDDMKMSYGSLPPYDYNAPFRFSQSTRTGYDNHTFLDDDDEEYEIMNRNSLNEARDAQKSDSENQNNTQTANKRVSSTGSHFYEIPNPSEEITL